MRPALVEMTAQEGPVLEDTFAPILYVLKYDTPEEAIALQNNVAQGLSSSLFSNDMREVEVYLSAAGSDAWKGYMRRQTNTIYYGLSLPLAQGVKFDVSS
ncbi:aldehyde dehydrogenase family protein [Acetobacter aceti]